MPRTILGHGLIQTPFRATLRGRPQPVLDLWTSRAHRSITSRSRSPAAISALAEKPLLKHSDSPDVLKTQGRETLNQGQCGNKQEKDEHEPPEPTALDDGTGEDASTQGQQTRSQRVGSTRHPSDLPSHLASHQTFYRPLKPQDALDKPSSASVRRLLKAREAREAQSTRSIRDLLEAQIDFDLRPSSPAFRRPLNISKARNAEEFRRVPNETASAESVPKPADDQSPENLPRTLTVSGDPKSIQDSSRLMRKTAPGKRYPPRAWTRKPLPPRESRTSDQLMAEFMWASQNFPFPRPMERILKILIEERKVKPTSSHYEGLILSQGHPEHGSIENVKTLLRELEEENMALGLPVLLATLTVLAVHPDTHLRCAVLDRLAEQHGDLPVSFAYLNIIALIREDQLEMATIELERLSQKNSGTPVPNWVWTVYLHAVCDLRRDFDGLLQLMYRLSDSGFQFPRPTLLYLLEEASKDGHVPVIKFIWAGYVRSMHIIPSEALCMCVLRAATKAQARKLAESAALVLQSVAGNTETDPPELEVEYARAKELNGDTPNENTQSTQGHTRKHTPPPATQVPLHTISAEALDLLASLGIDRFDPNLPDYQPELHTKQNLGLMYPFFPRAQGLAAARFDPRLALQGVNRAQTLPMGTDDLDKLLLPESSGDSPDKTDTPVLKGRRLRRLSVRRVPSGKNFVKEQNPSTPGARRCLPRVRVIPSNRIERTHRRRLFRRVGARFGRKTPLVRHQTSHSEDESAGTQHM
jgi:hypothetical protein